MQADLQKLPTYFPADLVAAIRHLSLAKGDWLFRTGDRVGGIFLVIKGEVKAVRHLADEAEAVMMRAQPGELFAESALASERYTCDAVAVKPSTLAFLPKADLSSALKNPGFAQDFFLANAINARRLCSRNERLRLRKARDRVLHLLTCESDAKGCFNWKNPWAELAFDLAIEPETLYRVLAGLEADGLIVRKNHTIKLNP